MSTTDEKDRLRKFVRWTDALLRSMEMCLQGDNTSNTLKYSGYRQFTRKYEQILTAITQEVTLPPLFDRYNPKMPMVFGVTSSQQKEVIISIPTNLSLLKAHLEGQVDVVEDEVAGLRDITRTDI